MSARLMRVELEAGPTLGEALRCLRADPRPFALAGSWFGGGVVLGSDPLVAHDGDGEPFEYLDRQPALDPEADGAVGGGWVGYLGYELRQRLEPGYASPPHAAALPGYSLAFYDSLLRCDAQGRWWFEALWTEERAERIERRLAELRGRLAAPPPPRRAAVAAWEWHPTMAAHANAVASCVERIHEGDLFQANVTLRLEGEMEGDALDLFIAAHESLPTEHAAFISGPWGALVSLSPELFLRREARAVASAPIKGTRPRPADRLEAESQRAELERSAKDRAENVMIVDLMRNDLGRVCEPGSVRVDALGEVRAHSGVWHMVSKVSGLLRDGIGDGELVRACFPPGSVTGAPKVAAMSVISELESTRREAYTGAIGMASPAAGLELSVAIRTLEVRGRRAWLGVGGGIVADSEPVAEAREAALKAAPLVEVLGGELPAWFGASIPAAPVPRRSARPTPRPDPSLGVFETIRVGDGEPRDLGAHLERLRASVGALYGVALPPGLPDRVRTAARGGALASLRITARPEATGLVVSVEARPLGDLPPRVELVACTLPGGLGAHKWLDRRLLEEMEAECAPALPLLTDADGLVLEASRANVLAVIGGALVTPPLDGRILAGVTRARALAEAREGGRAVEERPIGLDEFSATDEVFIASALRGLVPADLLGYAERLRGRAAGA